MIAMPQWRARLLIAITIGSALLVLSAHAAAAQPNADRSVVAQLIGVWRGTSTCTDRVAAPACRDEDVVYELTAGPRPDTVHWVADKIVNGQRERMGEFDVTYDNAEACWKVQVSSPRVTIVWRLFVKDRSMSGTARLLPSNETVREIALRKE